MRCARSMCSFFEHGAEVCSESDAGVGIVGELVRRERIGVADDRC